MQSFAEIKEIAESRKGGAEALEDILSEHNYAADFSALTDDRILSEFSKRVFQAGFNWSVVEKKWDGFEAAFHGFDIGRNAMMFDDDFDHPAQDTMIKKQVREL